MQKSHPHTVYYDQYLGCRTLLAERNLTLEVTTLPKVRMLTVNGRYF